MCYHLQVLSVLEYPDERGKSPFGEWFDRLNAEAAAKVTTALFRIEQGSLSNTKSVGAGVLEWRIDFGPGYRIYFGRDGTNSRHSARCRNEETAAEGYCSGKDSLA